jgi:hypothetical protein
MAAPADDRGRCAARPRASADPSTT